MASYAWFVRGEKHAKLCQVSMAAARRADKTADFVVATDDDITIPGARMVRFDPGLPLMVANIEAQLQVLHKQFQVPVCFLDTDVLFLKPFPHTHDCGITVTWRDTVGGQIEDVKGGVADAMPYNYGVIGVTPGLREIEAFIWIRERIRKMDPRLQQWWGNQIALASLAGPRPQEGETTETRFIPWLIPQRGLPVQVRKIPGSMWNFTPRDENEDLTGKGAVHFKGHTREWMEKVAKRLELPWLEAA